MHSTVEMLDLSRVPWSLHDRFKQSYAEGNPIGMLITSSNENGLAIVYANAIALLLKGIYEKALLHAYSGTRTNWAGWTLPALDDLFEMADRDRLLAAGTPLPDGETFTLYRGVAGARKYRKVCGYSWTRDIDKARWFANRYVEAGLSDPAVYVTTAARSEILACCHEQFRQEDDFIFKAKKYKRIEWRPVALG